MKKFVASVFVLSTVPFFIVGWGIGVLCALFGIGFDVGYGVTLNLGAKMSDWWSA